MGRANSSGPSANISFDRTMHGVMAFLVPLLIVLALITAFPG